MHCPRIVAPIDTAVYANAAIAASQNRDGTEIVETLAALIGWRRVRREVVDIEHRPQQLGLVAR
jgi:hypothetical protein